MTDHPPPFPEITHDVLLQIADRHNLNVNDFTAMPQIGIVNKLYLMGEDLVICRSCGQRPATMDRRLFR